MLLTSRACQLNPRDQNCDFSDTLFVTLGLFIHRDECISMHKQAFGGLLQGTHGSMVSLNFSWPGATSLAMRGGWWPCHMAPLVLPPHIPPYPLPSIPPPGNRKGKAYPPGRDLI